MYQLRLLASGTNNAHYCVGCEFCRPANPSKTATCSVRLESLPDLFWSDVAMVIQGVTFIECLLALLAATALAAIRSTMFLGAGTTTPTFHRLGLRVDALLLYLTHYHSFDALSSKFGGTFKALIASKEFIGEHKLLTQSPHFATQPH